MSEAIRIVLAVFAVYRLAALFALDDGPDDVFVRMRSRAGAFRYAEDGRPSRGMGRLVSCPHCLGVWFAAVVGAAVLFPTRIGDAMIILFGLAGAASWLQCVGDRE